MLQRLGLQCSTGVEARGNFVGLDAGISLTLFSEKTPHSLKPDVTRRPGSLLIIASAHDPSVLKNGLIPPLAEMSVFPAERAMIFYFKMN